MLDIVEIAFIQTSEWNNRIIRIRPADAVRHLTDGNLRSLISHGRLVKVTPVADFDHIAPFRAIHLPDFQATVGSLWNIE